MVIFENFWGGSQWVPILHCAFLGKNTKTWFSFKIPRKRFDGQLMWLTNILEKLISLTELMGRVKCLGQSCRAQCLATDKVLPSEWCKELKTQVSWIYEPALRASKESHTDPSGKSGYLKKSEKIKKKCQLILSHSLLYRESSTFYQKKL